MISVSAAYCPNCAALLSFEPGQGHVSCAYCEASLVLDTGRVTHQRSHGLSPSTPTPEVSSEPIAQPDPSLFVRDAPRFRTRVIEQLAPEAAGPSIDLFRTIELGEERFGIVSMRCIDSASNPVAMDLEPAWEVVSESLEDDGDPGLAANLALEELARSPAFQRLECVIAVLDPKRTTALVYTAGANHAALWVSTEEARPILAGANHQPLERADLAKASSQFENGRLLSLAAQDLLVIASFGYLNDVGIGSGFPRLMTQTLRDHLGEDPQRIVTLIKNEFWKQRESGHQVAAPLVGDLRIAAVGARLAEIDELEAPETLPIETFESRHFQLALLRAAREDGVTTDGVRFWPLAGDRHALLWLQYDETLPEGALEAARAGADAVLNRTSHGDFDNARAAGRSAYARIAAEHSLDPGRFRMLVLHLSDEFQRVKFFARGWKAPITLGARGLRPDAEQQQFDEGGECTVKDLGRLFFPGSLDYEGNVIRAADFAERWHGGKSSHLYEGLRLHWRTRKSEKALIKLVRAAIADAGRENAQGLMLVTGV
ncbi:hypothetical protein Poly30_15330 [Planctomycetes bacterium Poly30]|uniref:C2H2-type domain-containing protein n=1 Tax=Saltatorellus ferox TaxID=2528018 RepID=A0A518EPM0_9BACT|nr:hypothetical protein Poly30_15330 [Planctomycetes bacterium Poly30]